MSSEEIPLQGKEESNPLNFIEAFDGSEPFVMNPIRLIADKRLDGDSFKVLIYMLSRCKGWQFNTYDIGNFIGFDQRLVRSRLNILEKLGYLIRTQTRLPTGRMGPMNYIVSHKSICGKPVDNSTDNVNRNCQNALEPHGADRTYILPRAVKPASGKPERGKPEDGFLSHNNIDNNNINNNYIDLKKIDESLILKPARAHSTNIGLVGNLGSTPYAIDDDDFKKSGNGDELVARQLNVKLKDKISVADLRTHIERYGVEKVSETVLTLIEKGILNKCSPGGYLQSTLMRGGATTQSTHHEPEKGLKIDSVAATSSPKDKPEQKETKYTIDWWHTLDEKSKQVIIEKCNVPFQNLSNMINGSNLDIMSPNFGIDKANGSWIFKTIADICERYKLTTEKKENNEIKITNKGMKLNAPFVRPIKDVLADFKELSDDFV